MSDNDIFQVGLDPEETMIHVSFILLAVILLQAVTCMIIMLYFSFDKIFIEKCALILLFVTSRYQHPFAFFRYVLSI